MESCPLLIVINGNAQALNKVSENIFQKSDSDISEENKPTLYEICKYFMEEESDFANRKKICNDYSLYVKIEFIENFKLPRIS